MSCRNSGDNVRHAKRPTPYPGPRCKRCHDLYVRERRTAGRISTVKRLYGLTADQLAALIRFGRGRCYICRRRVGVVKAGAVDHSHALERLGLPIVQTVRGILCSTCNRWLGHIRDDPEAAFRAGLYLIHCPAQAVLSELDRTRPKL